MNTQHKCDERCKTVASLYILELTADEKAKKYSWDPFVRGLHEEYRDAIRSVREAVKGGTHV
jgi:hypothetical protein